MERRFSPKDSAPVTIHKRADGSRMVVGYGAVFYRDGHPGTEYQLWDNLYERIAPGAFQRALAERDDARGLFNHDPSHLLGRVSAGTMRLTADEKGLRYEIDLPDTQVGRDVAVSIERGDLTGSSFAFVPRKQTWIEGEDRDIRQIDDLELYDTGPVTYPAYEATSTGLRSMDGLKAEYETWKRSRSSSDAVAIRARLVQIGIDDASAVA